MSQNNPKSYCFMARKDLPCVKTKVAKKHLPFYECDLCIWRIKSEEPRHIKSLEKMFEKYGSKQWK